MTQEQKKTLSRSLINTSLIIVLAGFIYAFGQREQKRDSLSFSNPDIKVKTEMHVQNSVFSEFDAAQIKKDLISVKATLNKLVIEKENEKKKNDSILLLHATTTYQMKEQLKEIKQILENK